jgi:beta-lactamase class D
MPKLLEIALATALLPWTVLSAQPLIVRGEWRVPFDSAGVVGTFALRRIGAPATDVHDAARAARGYIPASTFKIPNSLIALEMSIVRDENQRFLFSWPKADIAEWNRDHTFRTALKYSVVPIYQAIARQVGATRYEEWLARLDYGNRDIRGGIDHFWLDGELRVTALQQIDFLTKLVNLELPVSERSQRIVKSMLLREANDCYELHAKTGLVGVAASSAVEPLGWYVGWVTTDSATWAFAMNIDVKKPGDAATRQGVTRAVLTRAGVIPSRRCTG